MSELLCFDAVSCIRGQRLLFDKLGLELRAGEALHITGPNGSGKSSLIRLAAGLLRPVAGKIERRCKAVLADEHLALDRELSLRKALRFWGGDVDAAMTAMAIAHLGMVPVRLLSTGQARRARLARVIASNASLWLLDEPLNGLDTEGAMRLADALGKHRAGGGAVLAASHQPLGAGWNTLELGT